MLAEIDSEELAEATALFDIYELLKGDLPYEIIERIDKIIQVDFFDKVVEYFHKKNNIKYKNNLTYYKLKVIFGTSELSTNVYSLDDIKVYFNKNNDWNSTYIKLPNHLIKNYVINYLDDDEQFYRYLVDM